MPAASHDAAGRADDVLLGLIEEHHAGLYGYLVLLLRDREDAADVLQETFARAYLQVQRKQPLVRAWLYRVARNLALDEMRRRKRSRAATTHLETSGEWTLASTDLRVQSALAGLSADDRELIYLADIDGMPPREIAEMYGIRAGAVRTRLCRAHNRFRAAYEEQE